MLTNTSCKQQWKSITRWQTTIFKVARLDFSRTHQPNFDWLILYCLGTVGQAASHNYYRLIELFKNISFVDIGVTMATKQ